MRKLKVVFLFPICCIMFIRSQSTVLTHVINSNCDSMVITPFGYAKLSSLHFVKINQVLDLSGKDILITDSKKIDRNKNLTRKSINTTDLNANSNLYNGWSTYVSVYPLFSRLYLSSFKTTWTVPSEPLQQTNQLIYIFIGLQGYSEGSTSIIQPVLQWGKSPAGGGNYWGVCNWYVHGDQFFYDTLIKVDPGTILRASIQQVAANNNSYDYTCSFDGLTSSFRLYNSELLDAPYLALETYNFIDCMQLPAQEKMVMSNIELKSGNDYPKVTMSPQNAIINCGQIARIVKERSQNGQVDIYFRTPSMTNYFDIIHIYPNPVKDELRISSLKEISDCSIQIFNYTGQLVQDISQFTITYNNYAKDVFTYSLDMNSYEPGVYFIRVSYEGKSHGFKIIKM